MKTLAESELKIALCQTNSTVGDFLGNAACIRESAVRAKAAGAGLLLAPEMSLVGYPAEDWLLRTDFCDAARVALDQLAIELKDVMPALVGTVWFEDGMRRNALAFLRHGKIEQVYFKQHLPEYGVFDEARVFQSGDTPCVIEVDGTRMGLAVCEDLWHSETATQYASLGAQVILSANASPFETGKLAEREKAILPALTSVGIPLVYVNAVGGQDELVFDGSGFVAGAKGNVLLRQKRFAEDLSVFPLKKLGCPEMSAIAFRGDDRLTEMHDALRLSLKDYVCKNGFEKVVVGLSGGIDSALVAAVAAESLGADNVLAVMMPTRFTEDLSLALAKRVAENLGIEYVVRPIESLFSAFQTVLSEDFDGRAWDVTEENLQARIRGTILMAYANKFRRLVITTGNKSETAVGYSTLYGDTAGAFALIKDVYKTDVWALARYLNELHGWELIPEEIITRPPTAELREGQKDEESLPPYPVLDAVLKAYVDEEKSISEAATIAGCERATVERVVHLVRRNEYKRRQSPTGPKLTRLAFGRDWRYPITSK